MQTDENFCAEDIDIVAKKFGIATLRPLQREVIQKVIAAVSDETELRQTVIMPTGAGKSLCFMLPAAIINGATLIVYPLLSLMADQKRRLEDSGTPCAVLSGGKSKDESEEEWQKIQNGAKIIIANPEILENDSVRSRLKRIRISHIVIDEAHCVFEWGESFRPSYLALANFISEINPPCVSAFTATATPKCFPQCAVCFSAQKTQARSFAERATGRICGTA